MPLVLAMGGLAWYADESEHCVEYYQRACAVLTAYGSVGTTSVLRAAPASALMDSGRWVETEEQLDGAATLAAVCRLRHIAIDVAALRATLAALRGRPVDAPADPAWSADDGGEPGHPRTPPAAARSDHDGAFRHFGALFAADGTRLHDFLSLRSVADLAAAARWTRRQEEIAHVVETVRTPAGPRPTTRMTLLLHHADAAASRRARPSSGTGVRNPQSSY